MSIRRSRRLTAVLAGGLVVAAGGANALATAPPGPDRAGTERAGTAPAGTEAAGSEAAGSAAPAGSAADPAANNCYWTPNEGILAGAEGALNIIVWAGYAEEAWVAPFEEIT